MAPAEPRSVAVIGAGRVGGAMGFLLARAGYRVTAVACRTAEAAAAAVGFIGSGDPTTDLAAAAGRADIVLVTTPDRAIREVCESVARRGGFRRGAIVAHASGAHTIELLDAAREAGALRAVIHPLQSVPDRERGVANIPGSYFRVEADPDALAAARALVRALGGVELHLPQWAPGPDSPALYHAGAVAVSNYLVALLGYGLRFFEVLGAGKAEALRAVLPLVKGTLENVERLGIPAALTGPVARGDAATVAGHLQAMRERAPELLALYRALARETIPLALAAGTITPQQADELLRLVRE